MSNQNPIELYRLLKPKQFPVLVRLELKQPELPHEIVEGLSLQIELRPFEPHDRRRLNLKFQGVTNLKLEQTWSEISFSLLDISALQDQQWEARYQVRDAESHSLIFRCKNFEAALK